MPHSQLDVPAEMPLGRDRPAVATIVHAFRHAVEVAADRPALVSSSRTLTYLEYGRCTAALVRRLARYEVDGRRVALAIPNSAEFAIASLAVLAARAQLTPLNPDYPPAEMGPLVADADPALLIAARSVAAQAREVGAQLGIPVLVFGEPGCTIDELVAEREHPLPPDPRPDQPATLMFTGGTTGIAKGVARDHAALLRTVQGMEASWPTGLGTEVWLNVAPMFHIWGMLMGLLNPLYGHATLVIVPKFRPTDVVHALTKYRVSVFGGGPAAVYSGLLSEAALATVDTAPLHTCPGGGSPFSADLLARWQRCTGVAIREAFGMTELAPITAQPPGRPPRAGSVGKPTPLVSIRIADPDDPSRRVPTGVVGEVLARAPHAASGYFNRPAETATTMVEDGWLRTGDLGQLDEEGYLYLVDRKKDMLLVSGFNVYPREIDEVLVQHPLVAESVTIGVPDERSGQRPVAFVTPATRELPDEASLKAYCTDRLVSYKLPVAIGILPQLPRNAANKIDRTSLRDTWLANEQAQA